MSDHSKTEFDDLNRELSGANSGKADRFFNEDSTPRGREEKERKEAAQRQFDNLLQQLLNDPEYRQAWERVTDKIDKAKTKLNAAMDKITARIEHLDEVIEDMESRAATMEDGTAVFKNANGQLITSDGRVLSAEEAALIDIPDDAPSWESYKTANDARTKARTKMDKLSGIQTDLDDADRKMRDKDNPPSKKDIEEIEKGVDKAITKAQDMTSNVSDFNKAVSTAPTAPTEELVFSPVQKQ